MSFDTATFWCFFVFAWLAWRALPFPAAKSATLVASLIFYGWWSPWYLPLIVLSPGIDYLAALRIAAVKSDGARRAWLVLSLGANLALLAVFKYAPFAVENWRWLAAQSGLAVPEPLTGWIIPVGISFYTFKAMSYTIDVYRGQIVPIRSFRDFLLFVTLFPELVAGPIVRASTMLPQLRARRALAPLAVQTGLFEIVLGLFLKVVVADNLAPAVGECFDRLPIEQIGPGRAWLGTFYFGGQVFADFAGYSAIAIGLARVMGLTFPENFKAPYIACSLSELWNRWHVSLSTWLRDYLYIPLGGNRHGQARTYAALIVTMLLGGLWHGASWNFVLWGAVHGLGLAVERAISRWRRNSRPFPAILRWGVVIVFFHLALVLFRSHDLARAFALYERMLVAPWREGMDSIESWNPRYVVFLVPVALVHVARLLEERRGRVYPAFTRAVLAGFLVTLLLVVGRPSAHAFIYFQF